MSRLTKLDRMSIEQKTAEAIKFWASPVDAAFPPETIAITFEVSLPWLQLKRCDGGGIPYTKPKGTRKVLYKKADVLDFFGGKNYNTQHKGI